MIFEQQSKELLDDIVQRIKSFGSLRKPSNRNYNSFVSWIVNTKPLSREEMIFVKHSEDFVALADSQEGGWLDGFVEDCLSYLPHQFAQVSFPSSRLSLSLLQPHASFPCFLYPCRHSSPVRNSEARATTPTCIYIRNTALMSLCG